jgi:E3 ubiquitin-protein ligase DOA10
MDESADLECRVCRGGPEPEASRPLLAPCLCSGSIMYCHQDCLEEWLAHSKKDRCELCSMKYVFVPRYSEGMPSQLTPGLVARESMKKLVTDWAPLVLKVTFALFMWFGVVPYITSSIYRALMRQAEDLSEQYLPDLNDGVVSGMVLAGTIALSFVIIVSVHAIGVCSACIDLSFLLLPCVAVVCRVFADVLEPGAESGSSSGRTGSCRCRCGCG